MSDDLVRATGLWLKDGKRGKFMSGQLADEIPAGAKLLIFKNDKKEPGSNQADYTLCFVPPDGQAPAQRTEPARQQADAIDDGIPF